MFERVNPERGAIDKAIDKHVGFLINTTRRSDFC